MKLGLAGLLSALAAVLPAKSAPFEGPPAGYTLVAEDDCGSLDNMPHVVRGKEYVFPTGMVSAPLPLRDIAFDDDFCLLRYEKLSADVRQVTRSKDGEWDPFLFEDGTLGFTRWEYVMKFWSPIQMLWSVRPDGTNPRMVYGSDQSKQYAYPLNYASARHIPGTNKLVCIGSAHHNTGAGPVCLIDLDRGRNAADGMARLTPVRFVETPDRQPHAGWYDCPYPLSDKYFLVSFSFSQSEAETTGYGLYLLDAYGGKELLHRDEELSAMFSMPLRPRPRPPGALGQNCRNAPRSL